MKKLEKLTLKEMSNEMQVISPCELPLVVGGTDAQTVINHCLGELEKQVSVVTDAVNETIDTISDSAKAAAGWVSDNSEKIGQAALIVVGGVIDFYLLKGTKAPTMGPTVLPGGDGSVLTGSSTES